MLVTVIGLFAVAFFSGLAIVCWTEAGTGQPDLR